MMYCRSCDYSLVGLPAGKCPECARAFDPADPASYEALPRDRTRRQQYAVGIGSAVAIGAVAWLGFRNASPPAPVLLLVVIAAGVLGLAAVVVGIRPRPSAPSRAITLLALLPALAMLGLFYSLAVHMHQSLEGWPKAIGTQGFSSSLETHAHMAFGYFSLLFLINLLALPVTLLLCVLVRRWRGGIFYLGVYALSYSVGFGAMLLAPSQFLNWWWD